MDTATILIVFLLVSAATLASYALSHWSASRGGISFGWAATNVGTTLLLIAAAIVVLSFIFRGTLWRPNLGLGQTSLDSAAASTNISPRTVASLETPPEATATSNPSPRSVSDQRSSRALAALVGESEQRSKPRPMMETAMEHGKGPLPVPPAPPPTFSDVDPWAATRCIVIYNPGSDTTHWKIENGCEAAPVGIILSSCSGSAQECWQYQALMFPAQLQRPLPLQEQTVHGRDVRLVACFVASANARQLLAAPSEERATAEWREHFESARAVDSCLTRVQHLVDQGRRTRQSVDVLAGANGKRGESIASP